MSSADTIIQREQPHGSYADTARTAQYLKTVIMKQKGWTKLSVVQRESLDLISTKIARILNGDPNHIDHWHDISGYALLVEKDIVENVTTAAVADKLTYDEARKAV